jgi:hypothetical protein
MRFEVLTANVDVGLNVVSSCLLVGRYQRFGGTYCLHLQHLSPEDGGSMFFRNVGIYLQVHGVTT